MELNVQVEWLPDGTFQSQCGNLNLTPERPLSITGGAATSLKLNLSRSDNAALNAAWFTKAYLAVVCEGEVLAAVETGHTVTAQSNGSLEICWPELPVNGTAIRAKYCDRRSDEVTAAAPLRRDYEGIFNCCRCALEIAGFAAVSDQEPQLRILIPAAIFPRWHRQTLPEETQQSYFYTKTEADTLLAAKQEKLSGTAGQMVGFDSDGNAVAQAAASLKGDKGDKGDTGDTGPANTLSIGTVTGGTAAAATITGTAPNQTLNLVLPKGEDGADGEDAAITGTGDVPGLDTALAAKASAADLTSLTTRVAALESVNTTLEGI